jgi:hypothetical protein
MLVTQHTAGYNGILWDLMGKLWETADLRGFSWPSLVIVSASFLISYPVDKSVYRATHGW